MWHGRSDSRQTVTCPACGESIARSEAREYDKEGNRWERHDKSFEHFCKRCFRELCHQPRGDLESTLADIQESGLSQSAFLARYIAAVDGETPTDDHDSE